VSELRIPAELLPADGRFGSGPSKVRPEGVARLAAIADDLLGTSHRKAAVRDQVRRLQDGLRSIYGLPDDYEVLMMLGGATSFWDVACFGLIEQRSRHYSFGEFGRKFVDAATAAPWLDDPEVVESEPGTHPTPTPAPDCDTHAYVHNETSTGVMQTPQRLDDALTLVDGTSAACGAPLHLPDVDVYYFSLQKGLGSEGGITVALVSPAAIARIESIAASDRYIPTFFNLQTSLENSRLNQTYNTPAVATLFLAAEQVDWMIATFGGLDGLVAAQQAKADHMYGWATARPWATPYVSNPAERSLVTATVDLDDAVSADRLNGVLRANGILDTDAYRKLNRNQLRIAMFPAITQGDLEAYTASVDWVVERILD